MTDAISAIITQSATKLIASAIASYVANSVRSIQRSKSTISDATSQYLESTFIRCTQIKTILSEDPAPLLSCHVEQTFQISSKTVDHYGLVEVIKNGESIVLTGTGGSGKSIFNKYLWTSILVDAGGIIPVYFELRQINDIDGQDILKIVYYNVFATGAEVTLDEFKIAVQRGEFLLLLDGFDEIIPSRRASAEKEIVSLKEKYPRVRMLVTSRPDERFAGWPQFKTAQIQPLEKEAVFALIRSAEFSEKYRNLMIKRLREGLLETHKTFLTNPLLCYLMLVTIANESKIETRMSLFYEQAFEALFYRHDLRKGGYVREMHSGLDKNQFRTAFAYFSMRTYLASKIDMMETEVLGNFSRAKEASSLAFSEDSILRDSVESVCLLKREGLDYSFTHRSLQEYFSSFCLTNLISKNFEQIITRMAERSYDQTLNLVFDMRPDLVISEYIIPKMQKYRSEILGQDRLTVAAGFFSLTISVINLSFSRQPSNGSKSASPKSVGFEETTWSAFHSSLVRLKSGSPSDDTYFFREMTLFFQTLEENSGFVQMISKIVRIDDFDIRVEVSSGKFTFAILPFGRGNLHDEPPTMIIEDDAIANAFLDDYFWDFANSEIQTGLSFAEELIACYRTRSSAIDGLLDKI